MTRLGNESQCGICTAGSYCDSLALIEPADLCDPGFYCLDGSVSSSSIVCPEGRYCPQGGLNGGFTLKELFCVQFEIIWPFDCLVNYSVINIKT